MTHYSAIAGHVRVEVFKPSGKWYTTLQVDMGALYNSTSIHGALEQAMRNQGLGNFVDNYLCVCSDPYHQNAHPIMLKRMRSNEAS